MATGKNLPDSEIDEILDSGDDNSDGRIDAEEVMRHMRQMRHVSGKGNDYFLPLDIIRGILNIKFYVLGIGKSIGLI